ncbi:CMRF35-like molecule 5 [Pseudochaenichthys georgianus]|uniref:CMRF35-like molecule 5 n=1 Tax=Pseudochaenichthys georgianus TaxID=52239 RepID=UPI0039C3EF61
MAVHLGFLLILFGLTGIHSITTVSKVSVRAGGSITIPCLYESKYRNYVKYLCKGSTWNFCSSVIKTNQQNSRKFSISDDKKQRVFNVTINDLTEEDTAYYWCAVEINHGADFKEYFHLSVTAATSLATTEPVKQTTSSADQTLSTVDGEQQSVSGNLKSFIIPLSLLIFIVMVAMFIWFMFKKHRQTKEESPATIIWSEANKDVDVMYSSVVAVERQTKQRSNVDVTYSTVKKKRKTSGQLGLAEEEVTYSDVKHMRRASEKLGLAEEEVTYSDVKHMRRASEKVNQ